MGANDNAGRISRHSYVASVLSVFCTANGLTIVLVSSPDIICSLPGQRHCSLLHPSPHTEAGLHRRWLLVIRHSLSGRRSGRHVHLHGQSVYVASHARGNSRFGNATRLATARIRLPEVPRRQSLFDMVLHRRRQVQLFVPVQKIDRSHTLSNYLLVDCYGLQCCSSRLRNRREFSCMPMVL